MLAALTLLPALLRFVGHRIDNTTWAAMVAVGLVVVGAHRRDHRSARAACSSACCCSPIVLFAASFFVKPLRRFVPHRTQPPREEQVWYRWSRFIQRRPWPSAIVAVLVLLLLAVPLLSIRLGFGDYGNYPEETTVRKAYDLVADGFGAGSNGPLFVTVEGCDGIGSRGAPGIRRHAAGDRARRVRHAVADLGRTRGGHHLPETAPQDEATSQLVDALRNDVIPASGVDAKVGGFTAGSTDFAEYLGGRMRVLIGVVLLLSFLLLMAVFRSLLVPLKAVVMNLLSIGAAYGVLVAIFQWGWGKGLIGVDKEGPIEAWVPMFLFAIVFGLSMDYEVFLLSRIKEEYDRTKDNATAVADGLTATARVITAAALIMFCVFFAFVLGDDRSLKLFGFGLAIAVLIDATIVRMLLVPATMELLGDKNWWIPKWLDRILPHIDVEGHYDEVAEDTSDDANSRPSDTTPSATTAAIPKFGATRPAQRDTRLRISGSCGARTSGQPMSRRRNRRRPTCGHCGRDRSQDDDQDRASKGIAGMPGTCVNGERSRTHCGRSSVSARNPTSTAISDHVPGDDRPLA